MKPNPGGILQGDQIIDRNSEISKIWQYVENQSVLLLSERRIGKTSILRKIEENPRNGWSPILYFIEGKSHPIEFVEGLYNEMLKRGMVEDKFFKVKSFYKKYIGGEQILSWHLPQVKENWKTMLEGLIEDIVESNNKVLFMFDELPLMLFKILNNRECGYIVVMDLLDLLRELRHRYEPTKKIAFIFSGSIGMNLIINKLKKEYGYVGEPVNDMISENLTGMEDQGALKLCEMLTEDAPFKFANEIENHKYLCNEIDNLPYYIHLIFEKFYVTGNNLIDNNSTNFVIDKILNDPNDRAHFRHYIERITSYYDKKDMNMAFKILNYICRNDDFIDEEDIKSFMIKSESIDDFYFLYLMNLLWEDHYLIRKLENEKRYYKFKYTLLRKWWKINRG